MPYRYCTGTSSEARRCSVTITATTDKLRDLSIHDSVGSDDSTTIYGKAPWAGMWRSIILSSIGVTAYPYCLWLKSLGLSDLEQLLRDVATNAELRPKFFEGPMQDFEIISGSTRTRAGRPILEWQRIIEKVAEAITRYAKDASDREDKVLQLTSLEGANLPTSLLSVWTSRLPTLTTLTIRDGSVLTEEVGISIRENCSAFKDLTCFHLRGPTVDENMSAFFRALKQSSLENFSVLSSNEIGYDTLEGLTKQHSESLKTLTLSSLQSTSLHFLHLLSSCPYLESLQIESNTPSPHSAWAADNEDPLAEVAEWLKGCKHLRKLDIKNLGGASKLLGDVLKSPDLRLRELEIRLVDDDEPLYTSLRSQSDLEVLTFRSMAEVVDNNGLRHDAFLDSICACKKLKELDIMLLEFLQLTPDDLVQIKESLPHMRDLSFDGEWLTDAIWGPLLEMPKLTTININGLSIFTFEGIRSFIERCKASGSRDGFRLYVMNQQSEARITTGQESSLSALAAQIPGGSFEFSYWRDPSEDEMSDLTD